MTHQAATPSEADAPRPWARAILHARIPAALKLLLLALFGALSMARTTSHPLRALRQDWLFATHGPLTEDLDSAENPLTLRRLLQLRAEIGWLMRGHPNRGMPLSGQRAPVPCPAQAARAPPGHPNAPITPNPSRKPRLRRRRLMPASGLTDPAPPPGPAAPIPPPPGTAAR